MKSLHTKILTLLLTSILTASILIGGAGVLSAGRAVKEDSVQIMSLTCAEKARDINEKLHEIEQSVDILYEYADNQFTADESFWTDIDYMNDYVKKVNEVLVNVAKNTEYAVAAYLRFNPEIFGEVQGTFMGKQQGMEEFQTLVPTDLSLYEPGDISHVGWYYIPIANGGPTWMEPYENKNLDINMISYIIPMYRDDIVIGVLGMDIDVRLLEKCVSAVSVYDTGYAFIVGEKGDIIYHKDYPQGLKVTDLDEDILGIEEILNKNQRQGKVFDYQWHGEDKRLVFQRLVNGMSLAIAVRAEELDMTENMLVLQCVCLLLLIAAIAVVFSGRMTRRMIKPLQELTNAAQKVAKGDWNVEVRCNSKDEIGVLAKTLKDTIEELNSTHNKLETLASTDALTGLYNRHYMTEYCNHYDKGSPVNVGVVFCDLNGLKYANDHYGHAGGDELLLKFAKLIRDCFPEDMCFRMGGDEFVVIVMQKTEEQFYAQLERLKRDNKEEQMPLASIGVCYKDNAENLGQLLTEAEDAMYQDKEKFYQEFPEHQR